MLARLSLNLQGCVYMTLAMFGFTVNDLFVKLLGETLPVFEIIAIRGLFICALLMVWFSVSTARKNTPKLPSKNQWPRIVLRAFLEVLATIAFLIALVRISFADVSAVMQSLPLVVTLGAAVFLGEPVGWRRWAAILVGLVGVIIIIRPGYAGFQPATLLVVLSVLFAAARDLITRTLPAAVNSYWVTVATAVSVASFGLLATTLFGEWQPVTLTQIMLMFSAASFLIVGYQCIIHAMRVGQVVFFAETPDKLTIIGSLIVVCTGLFTLYRERSLAS